MGKKMIESTDSYHFISLALCLWPKSKQNKEQNVSMPGGAKTHSGAPLLSVWLKARKSNTLVHQQKHAFAKLKDCYPGY